MMHVTYRCQTCGHVQQEHVPILEVKHELCPHGHKLSIASILYGEEHKEVNACI